MRLEHAQRGSQQVSLESFQGVVFTFSSLLLMKTRKAFFICLFLVAGGSILILLNTLLLTGTQNNWFRGKHLSIVRTVKGDSYSRRANTATDHNVSSQSSTSNAVLSNDKSGNGVEKVWSSNYNNDTIVSPQNQINTSSDDSGLKVVSGYLSVLDDQPLKMNCKTCSLVSNSGRILGQKKGSEIDEADCVFRMNHAPVEGFKNDVGQKTTARVVCQIGVLEVLPQVKQHTLPKFFIVWGGPHLSDHTTMKYRQLVKTAQMYPQMGIYRSIDEYDDYQDSLFRNETGRGRIKSGSWLSTGWFSIALMKQVCQRIQIYGMIPANYCRYIMKDMSL